MRPAVAYLSRDVNQVMYPLVLDLRRKGSAQSR